MVCRTNKHIGSHFYGIRSTVMVNAGLKAQIELLKDMVVQLPDIKNNQQMQQSISQFFNQYDSYR